MTSDAKKKGEGTEEKMWFNWPVVVGLFLNFTAIALIAGCIIHNL